MEAISRNVSEIELSDRQALEHVLGVTLRDSQWVVIQVLDQNTPLNPVATAPSASLPPWCNVYEGLSGEEIDAIESAIFRSSRGRSLG